MSDTQLVGLKAAMRREALRRRAAAGAGEAASAAIVRHVLKSVPVSAGAAVSAYWPMREEVDPRAALAVFHDRGHPLCLPVVVGKRQPLIFRAWRPGDTLVPGGFGTQVPDPAQAEIVPSVLLVPLLAFDRAGYRLGYGGGFYDRTLATLRQNGSAMAVGVAFAAQEVAAVPRDATDARLDWIVTEAEVIAVEPP